MGYFSFSMTFIIIIGGACFFLIGCTPTPKRLVDVVNVPNGQSFSETDCEILKKKNDFENYANDTEKQMDLRHRKNLKELEYYRKMH